MRAGFLFFDRDAGEYVLDRKSRPPRRQRSRWRVRRAEASSATTVPRMRARRLRRWRLRRTTT